MYQEQLAQITADHLRTHIRVYLDEVDALFTGSNKIILTNPKAIEVASVVGGEVQDLPNNMPIYAVDAFGKSKYMGGLDLWQYQYLGQINGMVAAASRDAVDKLVKRHHSAVERFIHRHQFGEAGVTSQFKITDFIWTDSDFSGAEFVEELTDREVWVAGFSINVIWITSEAGPSQHE